MEKPKFRADGTFVIAQFTDLHWSSGGESDRRTEALMEEVLQAERPDLVVITGDVIDSKYCEDGRRSFAEAIACIERARIPWAAVFGNHDTEHGVTRQQLMELQMSFTYNMAEPGPENLTGAGNFALVLRGKQDESAAALYFLDSGSYAPAPAAGYDWIRPDQIDWYRRVSKGLETDGRPLPALAFFHIPLPEYETVWRQTPCRGVKYEAVCAPRVNSGFGVAMLERGDVMGTFVGHDHINDYCGDWNGIRLCYGRATGFNTYGKEGFARGARIIKLREDERSFETWIRLEGGVIVSEEDQPLHTPEAQTEAAESMCENAQATAAATDAAEAALEAADRLKRLFHEAGGAAPVEQALFRMRLEGFLLLLNQVAPEHEGTLAKLAEHYHSRGAVADAGSWYARLLDLEGPQIVPAALAEAVINLAPELYTVDSEPFALRDCVAVIHPEHPVISYHLFWEDDWNFPHDYMPCDHEIVWVGYDPQTFAPVRIWSYFHGYVLRSQAAVEEARKHGGRPQVQVQWGIHGSLIAGGLDALSVRRTENGVVKTYAGMEVLEYMYLDAKNGGKRSDHPIKQGWPARFEGDFADYVRFTNKIDTSTYVAMHNRIHRSRWANAVLSQRALAYNAAPKLDWPTDILS